MEEAREEALEVVMEDSKEGWGFEDPEGILVSEPKSGGEEDNFEEGLEDVLEGVREEPLEVKRSRSRRGEGEELIEQ